MRKGERKREISKKPEEEKEGGLVRTPEGSPGPGIKNLWEKGLEQEGRGGAGRS